ncbi:MAG TPA: glycosyltransferase [Flavobacteriales bacterium]|nr:glycosyltransferase [Flavobacteriales bacterium]
MNIAIASTFYPYRGGIAQFNDQMANALKDAGHEVKCYNWNRQYPSLLFPGVAQTVSGTTRPTRSPEAPMDSISPNSWRKTARAILEEDEVDMVLLPYWHSALAPALRGVARAIKKLSPNTKVVAIMHNATSHDGKASDKWLTRRFLNRVDSCITLSKSVADSVAELAPKLPIKTLFHPLYNHYPKAIPSTEARKELGIPESAKHVALFFGLIRPYKGLATLIEATNSMADDTHLIIAGECYGPWDPYEKLISKSKASSRIHVINRFIPDSELPLIFGAADLVVLPYLNASQSGVTATAIHYNLPIIASNVGDLPSSISQNITGLLVSPGDSAKLGSAINNWFSSNHKSDSVKNEYTSIKESKSWTSFASQLV